MCLRTGHGQRHVPPFMCRWDECEPSPHLVQRARPPRSPVHTASRLPEFESATSGHITLLDVPLVAGTHLALMQFASLSRRSPKAASSSPVRLSADMTDPATLKLDSALKSSRPSLARRLLAIVRLKRAVEEVVVNTPPAVSAISSVCDFGDDSSSTTSASADSESAAVPAQRSVYQFRVRALREGVDALRASQQVQHAAAREAIIASDPIASRHPQQYPTDDAYTWALQQRRFRSTGWHNPKRAAGIWKDRVVQVLRNQPVPRQLIRVNQNADIAVPPGFVPRKKLTPIPHTVFCGPQLESEMARLGYGTRTRAETVPLPPSPVIVQEEKLPTAPAAVTVTVDAADFSYLKYEYNWTRAQGGWVPPLSTRSKNESVTDPVTQTQNAYCTLDDEIKSKHATSNTEANSLLPLPAPTSSCPIWTATYDDYDSALSSNAPWFVATDKRPIAEAPRQLLFKCLSSGAAVRRRSTRRRVSPCCAAIVMDELAAPKRQTKRVAFAEDVRVVLI